MNLKMNKFNLITSLVFVSAVTAFVGFKANATGLCSDAFHQQEVCERMRYLKASLNVLDGQRELVQVNYPYLSAISTSMIDNVAGVMNVIDLSQEGHLLALKDLKTKLVDVQTLSGASNVEAVSKANLLRSSCVACHGGDRPTSGVKWGDVFYYDWEKVASGCNTGGGNPYVCRSMNGLLTAYSHILTQMQAQVQDFAVVKQDGIEILRIFGEMKKANAFHMKPELVEAAVSDAQELVKLADAQDPEVYTKAYDMSQACSHCHVDFGKRTPGQPFFKKW